MNKKNLIIEDFELGYAAKASDLNYKSPNFKPHWEVQLLTNGWQHSGTKEECIDWMSEFYLDRFGKTHESHIDGTTKALNFIKKKIKEAEAFNEYGRKLSKQEMEWYEMYGAIHPRELVGY